MKILKMNTLIPMIVTWEDNDNSIVLVDIISEKSFSLSGEELSDSLSTPIKEVIQSKKVNLQEQTKITEELRKNMKGIQNG
jgi:hypothetical protein